MKRMYEHLLREHFANESNMLFLVGPRQVGKTTTAVKALPGNAYLNWDNQEHAKIILQGPSAVMEYAGGECVCEHKRCLVFDEIHKYPRWKNFLKGFFDTYRKAVNICVTGSARLDVYKYGGDSLMGRYFPYRMHPLSIRELVDPDLAAGEVSPPKEMPSTDFERLLEFGGYPEPYLRNNRRFYNRWKRLRLEQLFREDIRDLTGITDIGRVRALADKIAETAGSRISYSGFAGNLQASVDTIRRWIEALESIYYCFRVRPYSKNVARSLLKEPKIFLWDWAALDEPGKRHENFVASHLLKAVHYYTDMGMGEYGLHYLRDKDQREVDFLVSRNGKPWFLAEVKTGDRPLSGALSYFKKATGAPHAFQITFDQAYVGANCFDEAGPVKVPAKTLLSQLV